MRCGPSARRPAASTGRTRAAGRSHTVPPGPGNGHSRSLQGVGTPRPSCGAAGRRSSSTRRPPVPPGSGSSRPPGDPAPPGPAPAAARGPARQHGRPPLPAWRPAGTPRSPPGPGGRRSSWTPPPPGPPASGSAPPSGDPAPPAPAPAAIHVQPQHPRSAQALRQSLERRCTGIPPILPQARILPGNPGIRPGSRPARTSRHRRTRPPGLTARPARYRDRAATRWACERPAARTLDARRRRDATSDGTNGTASRMKALVKAKAEPGLVLEDVPEPQISRDDVLIRVLRTGVCGTDLHIYEWDGWAMANVPVPVVVGHEFVGEIVDIGADVHDLQRGDLVSGEGHLVCGRCRNCMAGRRVQCAHTKGVGVNYPGAFAEFIALPATNVWRRPPDIDLDVAAIFDPFGNAVHTALTFPVLGEDVLITG